MTHAAHPVRPAHQARTRHATLPAPDLLEYRCSGPYLRTHHVLDVRPWACFDQPGNPNGHPAKGPQ